MKLVSLELENFRGVDSLKLPLDGSLTLITGSNGAGKSTILDAIAILLSWVTARTRSQKGSGRSISENEIQNKKNTARLSIETNETDNLHWQIAKVRPGRKAESSSDLTGLKKYISKLQTDITETNEQCSIPLFAYYPVNRAVLDIPLRIRTAHTFTLLEAWDESLASAANFRSFFEWFRQREDLENEFKANENNTGVYSDKQLEAVRKALSELLPEFSNFKVTRVPLRMLVSKNGEELSVDQLSDGEKCQIALVGDMARRLAIANPTLERPLDGEGIVLIDEIDLHLHPIWQRRMIRQLPLVFKNCQFILTTHSPQALGEIKGNQLRVLYRNKENQIKFSQPRQSYGLTSNDILNELMVTSGIEDQLSRNPDVEKRLRIIFDLIDDEKLNEATSAIVELENVLDGEIPELAELDEMLDSIDEKHKV